MNEDKSTTKNLYLISSEHCPGCDVAKKVFNEEIANGTIKVLTIDDDKGWDIIRKLKLKAVPQLVLEEKGRYCKINLKGEIDECTVETKTE